MRRTELPYDNVLELMFQPEQKAAPQEFVTRNVVCSEEPSDLVDYVINRYLEANLEFRVCKYCGRYFGTRCGSKGDYCERMIEGSTKTCKQAGSVRLYEKRKFEIPAVKEYTLSYKDKSVRVAQNVAPGLHWQCETIYGEILHRPCKPEHHPLYRCHPR